MPTTIEVATDKCSPEAISHSERASSGSSAVAALSDLFTDCVRDKWTPLRPEHRDRLAQQFDETLSRVTDKVDSTPVGSFPYSCSCIQRICWMYLVEYGGEVSGTF